MLYLGMSVIYVIISFFAALFYSILASSNIILPLFRGIPFALKLRMNGKVFQLSFTIIIWLVITYFLYRYSSRNFEAYYGPIHIGLFIGFAMTLWKAFKGGEDIKSDQKDFGLK